MTTAAILRRAALHASRQLRRYPPRMWHMVEAERRALVLLAQAHGRWPKAAPMQLDPQGRWRA